MSTRYHSTHYVLEQIDTLQATWETLYAQSPGSVFLSWPWIEAWLKSLPSAPLLLCTQDNGRCVGLALFSQSSVKTRVGVTLKQLWLHSTGDQILDQMWIEHNDFLLAKQNQHAIREAMLAYIQQNQHLWHELYVGLAPQNTLAQYQTTLPFHREVVSSPDFEVNLVGKTSIDDYLQDLSKNTRAQIRRTEKRLRLEGEITLSYAQNAEQKEQYFAEIAVLHQQKWRETEFGSGFDNAVFSQFHQRLTAATDTNNITRLYCLSVNHIPLAYIYLLKAPDTWYFYLSAIKQHEDNRIKVGLLAHTLIIKEAISMGISGYSFLAGEARYKRSLSNTPETMQTLMCFYRPSPIMRLRELSRNAKETINHVLNR